MSLKFGLSAILLLAAAPALAQTGGGVPAETTPAAPAQPSPALASAIQTAAQAFGTCVQTGMQGAPATATPDAAATSVLAGCSAQRAGLVQAVSTMIASLPADQRAEAQAQADSQLAEAQIHSQIVNAITQHRAAPAAAPAQPAH
jgi:hypothetical protein